MVFMVERITNEVTVDDCILDSDVWKKPVTRRTGLYTTACVKEPYSAKVGQRSWGGKAEKQTYKTAFTH
jgi:hypothetical protein